MWSGGLSGLGGRSDLLRPINPDQRIGTDWKLASCSDPVLCDNSSTNMHFNVRECHMMTMERTTQRDTLRSEEHTSELQSLMRISYAVLCLTKKTNTKKDSR